MTSSARSGHQQQKLPGHFYFLWHLGTTCFFSFCVIHIVWNSQKWHGWLPLR